ncbi:hypothetical protein NL676_006455 [Syzygium grande]|nr:hypothetical protein NL676_006455 [Syzygium grande]
MWECAGDICLLCLLSLHLSRSMLLSIYGRSAYFIGGQIIGFLSFPADHDRNKSLSMGPRWKGKGAEVRAQADPMSEIVSRLKSSLIESNAHGSLSGCSVLLAVEADQSDLLNQACFGRPVVTAEKDKQWFQLSMEEAFYLCYTLKCLDIHGGKGDSGENGRLRVWSDVHCTVRLCGSVAKAVLVLYINKHGHGNASPSCVTLSGPFNYDAKYKGATAKAVSILKEDDELYKDGFLLNHARVLVGSGRDSYEKGKNALQSWRHFGLNWAFVDSKTQVQKGVKFCVCVKEFLPWLVMPLEVVFVNESQKSKKGVASFRFGSGTLKGHLLVGNIP